MEILFVFLRYVLIIILIVPSFIFFSSLLGIFFFVLTSWRRIRNLSNRLHIGFRQAGFVWLILSNSLLQIIWNILILGKRVVFIGYRVLKNVDWLKGGILIVYSHPAWTDPIFIFQLLPYFQLLKNPDIVPYYAAAKDNIQKMKKLQFFQTFCFVTPVDRTKRDPEKESRHDYIERVEAEIKKMEEILLSGKNLIIAGPAGREFKKEEDETIISPLKKKKLREYAALCGRLATLPGVLTINIYIEGTEKTWVEKMIWDDKDKKNKKDMVFSWRKCIWDWLIKKKFTLLFVVTDSPLQLQGFSHEAARKKIQEVALNLADKC